MTSAIHNVLQAMDDLANVPVALAVRLVQPAPPRRFSQDPAELKPPKVVKRKRRLTLPLDPTAPRISGRPKWLGKQEQQQQRTCYQQQSPLMRLPAELRAEIWSHVILGGKKDGVIPIRWRSTGSGRGRASALVVLPPGRSRDDARLGVLGMLRSCRMIYSEAINLLYSLPIFEFSCQNVETFLAFVCAIPQYRRDQIRYLDLSWLTYSFITSYRSEGRLEPQKSQVKRNVKWSYWRISGINALSGLPDATTAPTEDGFVHADWIISEVLKTMSGLELGGVNRNAASTGCFAR